MVKIDSLSGLLANSNSNKIIYEAFISGTAPKIYETKSNGENENLKPLDGQIY